MGNKWDKDNIEYLWKEGVDEEKLVGSTSLSGGSMYVEPIFNIYRAPT